MLRALLVLYCIFLFPFRYYTTRNLYHFLRFSFSAHLCPNDISAKHGHRKDKVYQLEKNSETRNRATLVHSAENGQRKGKEKTKYRQVKRNEHSIESAGKYNNCAGYIFQFVSCDSDLNFVYS